MLISKALSYFFGKSRRDGKEWLSNSYSAGENLSEHRKFILGNFFAGQCNHVKINFQLNQFNEKPSVRIGEEISVNERHFAKGTVWDNFFLTTIV